MQFGILSTPAACTLAFHLNVGHFLFRETALFTIPYLLIEFRHDCAGFGGGHPMGHWRQSEGTGGGVGGGGNPIYIKWLLLERALDTSLAIPARPSHATFVLFK